LSLLRPVLGIGNIPHLVLLYEIHDIHRFPRVQDCVSYSPLVKYAKESTGTRYGISCTKIGTASLKWAFSEAAVLYLRYHPAGQKLHARWAKTPGQGNTMTVLAHKLARAVYYMVKRDTAFDLDEFLHS
jgi:transposase